MHSVHITFARLDELSVGEALGAVGVYVLWDSYQSVRPTYVGQGTLLARLVHHLREKKLGRPIRGYAGIVGDGSRASHLQDCLVVEALLLQSAQFTDRWPQLNTATGVLAAIDRLHRNHGMVRVHLKGYDPFVCPDRPRRMQGGKVIRVSDRGESEVPWPRRRKLS